MRANVDVPILDAYVDHADSVLAAAPPAYFSAIVALTFEAAAADTLQKTRHLARAYIRRAASSAPRGADPDQAVVIDGDEDEDEDGHAPPPSPEAFCASLCYAIEVARTMNFDPMAVEVDNPYINAASRVCPAKTAHEIAMPAAGEVTMYPASVVMAAQYRKDMVDLSSVLRNISQAEAEKAAAAATNHAGAPDVPPPTEERARHLFGPPGYVQGAAMWEPYRQPAPAYPADAAQFCRRSECVRRRYDLFGLAIAPVSRCLRAKEKAARLAERTVHSDGIPDADILGPMAGGGNDDDDDGLAGDEDVSDDGAGCFGQKRRRNSAAEAETAEDRASQPQKKKRRRVTRPNSQYTQGRESHTDLTATVGKMNQYGNAREKLHRETQRASVGGAANPAAAPAVAPPAF
jgi:hypothetical protein